MAPGFREQVILLTGASEGIGRELALQLAGEGAWLVLASRNPERLELVAQECRARGGSALAIPTNVADPAACSALVDAAVREFGRLDMLLNNAGISMFARYSHIRDVALPERIVRTNFLGAVYCTTYALPFLQETRGRIVIVSSLAGKIIAPGATAYAASKAALGSFFDALRAELKQEGVSVTVAYPGFVRTEIYKRFLDAEGNMGPDRTALIPPWTMMSVERCARRILRAARYRRREVGPTALERLIVFANRFAPRWVEYFWQGKLRAHLPAVNGPVAAPVPAERPCACPDPEPVAR